MTSRIHISLILVAALTAIAGLSHAQGAPAKTLAAVKAKPQAAAKGGPQAFLEGIDAKLKPLLKSATANKNKIVGIVNDMLDFPKLCKESLGKHWDGKTAAQQKDFSDTLKALIEKNVVKRLRDTSGHIITYESETINGKAAKVVTIVADGPGARAVQTEIAYELEKRGGSWVVVDMSTDGVSLVSNYRSQFHKIITTDGWDAMMQKMRDKLAEP